MNRKVKFVSLIVPATMVGLATLVYAGSGERSGAGVLGAAFGVEAEKAEVIAVKFHADWCGYCKAMGPVFEEMQAKYDREPVLFVELDQTREFGRRQSAYLAQAMGLGGVWDEHGGKTGFVLLIDADTKSVIGRLGHEQGLKQMGSALQEAVEKAS